MHLQGSLASGNDVATWWIGPGQLFTVQQPSLLGLSSQEWTSAEFNVFGFCCGDEAVFNAGTTINPELQISGSIGIPSCQKTGFTGETNNLTLLNPCCAYGGASPDDTFVESNIASGSIQCAVCTPGTTRCDPNSNGIDTCDASGQLWGPVVACEQGVCQDGGCAGAIVQFQIASPPATASEPAGPGPWNASSIVVGSDGNLWFTEGNWSSIARITPSGSVTQFPVPFGAGQSDPNGITAGPGGNLWFTDFSGQVGMITTAGAVSTFSAPLESDAIALGSDGNLWATVDDAATIARVSTNGVVSDFSFVGSNAYGIAPGPDGNLWFSSPSNNEIGQMTTGGVVTEFPIPTASSEPMRITPGPDGNMWFTEFSANNIGRITMAGVVTEFPVPTAASQPYQITAGLDGNLWFTEFAGNKIARITTAGVITEFEIPIAAGQPMGITWGPDGNVWFTENITIPGIFSPGGTVGYLVP
jgi:streptogramin lyase